MKRISASRAPSSLISCEFFTAEFPDGTDLPTVGEAIVNAVSSAAIDVGLCDVFYKPNIVLVFASPARKAVEAALREVVYNVCFDAADEGSLTSCAPFSPEDTARIGQEARHAEKMTVEVDGVLFV